MSKRLSAILVALVVATSALIMVAPTMASYPNDGPCSSYQWALYQDPNQGGPQYDNWISGQTCDLRDNDLRTTNQGDWNDRADSIVIFHLPSNRIVHFCRDIDYGGGCIQKQGPINLSNAWFLNSLGSLGYHDAISSYYVSSTSTP